MPVNTSGSSSAVDATIYALSVANYDTADRYTTTNGGTGTVTFGSGRGVIIATGDTNGGTGEVLWQVDPSGNIYSGSPECGFSINCWNDSHASYGAVICVGYSTIAGLATNDHAGFKLIKTGGVATLYATQSAGGAETASSALTTCVEGDTLDLSIKFNSTTSVSYYWRKNGGALSNATTLSTNVPTSGSNAFYMSGFVIATGTDAGNSGDIMVNSAFYRR